MCDLSLALCIWTLEAWCEELLLKDDRHNKVRAAQTMVTSAVYIIFSTAFRRNYYLLITFCTAARESCSLERFADKPSSVPKHMMIKRL